MGGWGGGKVKYCGMWAGDGGLKGKGKRLSVRLKGRIRGNLGAQHGERRGKGEKDRRKKLDMISTLLLQ